MYTHTQIRMCKIRFVEEQAAIKAIALNGTALQGRTMYVEMQKPNTKVY